jgi:hypothetical protein
MARRQPNPLAKVALKGELIAEFLRHSGARRVRQRHRGSASGRRMSPRLLQTNSAMPTSISANARWIAMRDA